MDKKLVWKKIRNLLCVIFAIAFWVLSMVFSQIGFGITVPTWAWAGWVLAGGVTVLELVLNSGDHIPPTLLACGAIAYLYGIGTNVYGIVAARTGMSAINGWDWAMAVVVGVAIEVVPEPLFLYGLGINLGDLLTNLLGGQYSAPNGQGGQKAVRPDTFGLRTDYSDTPGQTDMPGQTDSRQFQRTDGNPTEKAVRAYAFRNRKPGGELPSVRDVAKAIGKDKSTVGEIMAEMRKRL